ncbi:MAG TPA: hypothetical protein VGJ31_12870 [Dongiaceae bacterium]
MSETFGDWLQFHYLPALLVACIALAVLVAIVDARFNPKHALSAESGASTGFAAPLTRNAVFLFLAGIGLGLYFWLMLAWEDFTFYDAHIFFQSLAGGPQYAPLQLFPSLGLLRPLSHQEFYPLSFIDNSAAVYQAFSFLQILLGGFLLSRLLRGSLPIMVLTFVAILLAPPVVAALFHIINSERNILLLLCIFLWSSLAYERTRRAGYLVLAAVASFLALQYKETAAVMMGGWAGYLLLAGWLARQRPPGEHRVLALLGGSVAAGCIIWFAAFAIAILPQIGRSYLVGRSHDPLLVLQVLASQVWVLALAGAILCRFLLARRGIHTSPIWDGVPVAALALTAAYVKLGFIHEYYYAPATLLAWLYAGHVAQLALANSGPSRRPALIGILALVAPLALFQTLTSFWWVYAPWKENVASKADAARFIEGLHAARPPDQRRQPLRIAFPRSSNYEAAFFIGYLEARYRILDIEVDIGILARDRLASETSQCVLWVPVMCNYGLSERRGDVAVFFGEEGDDLAALKAAYHLIYVSPDIGFWPNRLHAYVFGMS